MSHPFFNTNQSGLNINANNITLIGTTGFGAGIIHNDSTGKLFSALIQGSDIGYQTITSDKLSPDIILAGAQGLQGIGSTGIIITNNNTATTSYLVLTNGTDPTNYQSLTADTTTGPLSYVPSTGALTVGALNVGNGFTNTNNFYNPINLAGPTGPSRKITNVGSLEFLDISNTTNKASIYQYNKTLSLSPFGGVTGGIVNIQATNNIGTQLVGLSVTCNGGASTQVDMNNTYTLNDPINSGQIAYTVDGAQGLCRNANLLTLGKSGTSGTKTQWEELGPTGVNQVTFSSTAALMNFNVPVTVGANNLKCSYIPLAADDVANKSYCDNKVADLVASAPATLNTLNELAVALNNEPNFAANTATLIGTKASLTATQTILGINTLSNASNVYYGNGTNLTGVNASTITTATIPSTGTYYIPFTTSSTGTSGLIPYTQNSLSYTPSTNRVFLQNLSTTGQVAINNTFNSLLPTTASLSIKTTSSASKSLSFYPNINATGSWNSINVAGDNAIIATGTVNSEPIVLTTHSNTTSGVKVSGNAVLLGAGGNISVPTTNVSIDGAANTLSLTTNSIAAISIASTGISTFSAPPQCSVAPTTANMLCNKTYVDGKITNSRPKFGINITDATNGNLSSEILAEFYTVDLGASGYAITLPTPSSVIAGTTVSFRRIAGTSVLGNFMCTNSQICFMRYSPATITTTGSSTPLAQSLKVYTTLSDSLIFAGNFTTVICDATTWYQIDSW